MYQALHLTRRRSAGAPGGCGSFGKIQRDVRNILLDGKPDALTTMFDLYAFPRDMPGLPKPMPHGGAVKAEAIEAALSKAIDHRGFLPNLLVHELEGLLFSSPEIIAAEICGDQVKASATAGELLKIAGRYATPEDINESPLTAPSKRLKALLPRYSKTIHGSAIAKKIGLTRMRDQCPHFSSWIARLEGLASQKQASRR